MAKRSSSLEDAAVEGCIAVLGPFVLLGCREEVGNRSESNSLRSGSRSLAHCPLGKLRRQVLST